jgi:hypothetical protein
MCESRNDGTNGCRPANGTAVSPSERASEIDFSKYVFEHLRSGKARYRIVLTNDIQ